MNIYNNFSDEDLLAAYVTVLEHTGRIDGDLLAVINQRGGPERFRELAAMRAMVMQELNRISKEVRALSGPGSTPELVQGLITSDILPRDELDALIQNIHAGHIAERRDVSVTSRTIWGSIGGTLLGSAVGGTLWVVSILLLSQAYYGLLIPIYIINYFILRLITGQSRGNLLVFIASVFSMIGTLVIGWTVLY